MSFVIENDRTGEKMFFTPGTYTIGRKDCDIDVSDPSVSRKHATIHISAPDDSLISFQPKTSSLSETRRALHALISQLTPPKLTVTDTSQFGTKLNHNHLTPHTPTPIDTKNTNTLTLGQAQTTLKIKFQPSVLSISRLDSETLDKLTKSCKSCGIYLLATPNTPWVPQTQALVTNNSSCTPKVLRAILAGVPIVSPAYIDHLLTQKRCWKDHPIPVPTMLSHLPPSSNRKTLLYQAFKQPNRDKINLLNKHITLFTHRKDYEMLADVVAGASGIPCYIDLQNHQAAIKNLISSCQFAARPSHDEENNNTGPILTCPSGTLPPSSTDVFVTCLLFISSTQNDQSAKKINETVADLIRQAQSDNRQNSIRVKLATMNEAQLGTAILNNNLHENQAVSEPELITAVADRQDEEATTMPTNTAFLNTQVDHQFLNNDNSNDSSDDDLLGGVLEMMDLVDNHDDGGENEREGRDRTETEQEKMITHSMLFTQPAAPEGGDLSDNETRKLSSDDEMNNSKKKKTWGGKRKEEKFLDDPAVKLVTMVVNTPARTSCDVHHQASGNKRFRKQRVLGIEDSHQTPVVVVDTPSAITVKFQVWRDPGFVHDFS